MHDHPEAHISSAKQLHELNKKREKKTTLEQEAANKTNQIESSKLALLKEANDLALKAHLEAQESRVESEKSSKRAFWSNVIAVISLLVAMASLILTYVSSGT